jgi:hypothetical protein
VKLRIIGRINIAENEIGIKNQFTLILGKFKKEQINQFQEFDTNDLFENSNVISFEKILTIFKNETNNLRFGEILDPFLNNTEFLIQIIERYCDLTQYFNQSLQLRIFSKENENLEKVLEIRKKIDKKPNLKDTTDEIEDLNNLILEKYQTLNYLEEDFIKQKMKKDRFSKSINSLQAKLKNLNLQKEKLIKNINVLTGDNEASRDTDNELTDSQKILKLQQQIRDYNYEMKKINENIEEESAEFREFKLNFSIIEEDYKLLESTIDDYDSKLNKLKKELAEDIDTELEVFEMSDLLKSHNEIIKSIQDNNLKIKNIQKHKFFDKNQSDALSPIYEELTNIKSNLTKNKINFSKGDIEKSVDFYQNIKSKIIKLEEIINKFLMQIYLKYSLEITIKDNKNLFVQQKFFQIRKKTTLNFKELTTPEKIFFLIVLDISLRILFNKKIIYSNLFLPVIYNKHGSIVRTLRKIIPIFERETELQNFNLIFILSNVEMKEKIKNLEVIKIN